MAKIDLQNSMGDAKIGDTILFYTDELDRIERVEITPGVWANQPVIKSTENVGMVKSAERRWDGLNPVITFTITGQSNTFHVRPDFPIMIIG